MGELHSDHFCLTIHQSSSVIPCSRAWTGTTCRTSRCLSFLSRRTKPTPHTLRRETTLSTSPCQASVCRVTNSSSRPRRWITYFHFETLGKNRIRSINEYTVMMIKCLQLLCKKTTFYLCAITSQKKKAESLDCSLSLVLHRLATSFKT